MVDKIQDLNLPNSSVIKIIKDALPDGINVGKEARTAIARAASVFVMYLTASTATAAKEQNHKTLSPENVFSALEEMDFDSFIEPLRETLVTYRKIAKAKKAENKAIHEDTEVTETETVSEVEN